MTQKEKIKRMENLFDQIKELFPDNSVSLNIYGIDRKDLSNNWEVSRVGDDGDIYKALRINRGKEFWDIRLFLK